MTKETWKYIMAGGMFDYSDKHTGQCDIQQLLFNIRSPVNEQNMNKDTAHRTQGRVKGTQVIFEPEEIQLFEQLLIRK